MIMQRPQRNLMALLIIGAALILSIYFMPPLVQFSVVLLLVAILTFLIVISKDFLIARVKGAQLDWTGAIKYYDKFERQLKEYRRRRMTFPFFMSIYTCEGLALTYNNRGQCYMNLRRFADAEHDLNQAVKLDLRYAIPHANLAIMAAMQGDESVARYELDQAQSLGYKVNGLQMMLSHYLAKVNQTIGSQMV
jgi:tetratricopeptide (TPR) repeat protein